MTQIFNPRLSRRGLMGGAAAMGLAAALDPRFVRAQGGGVLRVRSYSDLQVLDPAFRLSAPEGDIMHCIFAGLVRPRPGDEWTWKSVAV
ncbi:MAG: peptide ABC transporter substrate-binding protein, partial [Alphaproteobacteria bacterium]